MEILLLIVCILMNTSFTLDSVHFRSYYLSEINFCNQANSLTLSFYFMQTASRTSCLCCAFMSVDRTLILEGLKGLESSSVSLLLYFHSSILNRPSSLSSKICMCEIRGGISLLLLTACSNTEIFFFFFF